MLEEYSTRRQNKDYQDGLPVPLLAQRSYDKSTQASQLRLRSFAATQHTSPLFSRLPTEVRLLIWEYAIGREKVHIVCKYRRLGHVVCNTRYWAEARSKMPSMHASSYLFTYASLPTTKQLADWSKCNLLVACRRIYDEAVPLLYQTNTFVFWDLRVITALKHATIPSHWEAIRSIEVHAMCYRKEDIDEAIEAKSRLQLHAWPSSSITLAALPCLQRLRVFVANPFYLDCNCLAGRRATLYQATFDFLAKLNRLQATCEIFLPTKRKGEEREECLWNLKSMNGVERERLEVELKQHGLECTVYMGDVWSTEEEIERKWKR